MNKFVIIIPSYKNSKWYKRNISSAITQDYPKDKFRVIYTDDLSPDDTGNLAEKFFNNYKFKNIKLIKNKERVGAMKNIYDMVHSCQDDEIILTLDGDDYLANNGVLRKLNQVYSDPNVWVTYGSYMDWPGGSRGCSKQIPQQIIDNNSFRRHPWCFSHLRTFKADIFKMLPESDFKINDKWMQSAWDLPIMFGLAELSGNRMKYIHDILYIYNNDNPISDYKIRLQEQQSFERMVRARKPHARI